MGHQKIREKKHRKKKISTVRVNDSRIYRIKNNNRECIEWVGGATGGRGIHNRGNILLSLTLPAGQLVTELNVSTEYKAEDTKGSTSVTKNKIYYIGYSTTNLKGTPTFKFTLWFERKKGFRKKNTYWKAEADTIDGQTIKITDVGHFNIGSEGSLNKERIPTQILIKLVEDFKKINQELGNTDIKTYATVQDKTSSRFTEVKEHLGRGRRTFTYQGQKNGKLWFKSSSTLGRSWFYDPMDKSSFKHAKIGEGVSGLNLFSLSGNSLKQHGIDSSDSVIIGLTVSDRMPDFSQKVKEATSFSKLVSTAETKQAITGTENPVDLAIEQYKTAMPGTENQEATIQTFYNQKGISHFPVFCNITSFYVGSVYTMISRSGDKYPAFTFVGWCKDCNNSVFRGGASEIPFDPGEAILVFQNGNRPVMGGQYRFKTFLSWIAGDNIEPLELKKSKFLSGDSVDTTKLKKENINLPSVFLKHTSEKYKRQDIIDLCKTRALEILAIKRNAQESKLDQPMAEERLDVPTQESYVLDPVITARAIPLSLDYIRIKFFSNNQLGIEAMKRGFLLDKYGTIDHVVNFLEALNASTEGDSDNKLLFDTLLYCSLMWNPVYRNYVKSVGGIGVWSLQYALKRLAMSIIHKIGYIVQTEFISNKDYEFYPPKHTKEPKEPKDSKDPYFNPDPKDIIIRLNTMFSYLPRAVGAFGLDKKSFWSDLDYLEVRFLKFSIKKEAGSPIAIVGVIGFNVILNTKVTKKVCTAATIYSFWYNLETATIGLRYLSSSIGKAKEGNPYNEWLKHVDYKMEKAKHIEIGERDKWEKIKKLYSIKAKNIKFYTNKLIKTNTKTDKETDALFESLLTAAREGSAGRLKLIFELKQKPSEFEIIRAMFNLSSSDTIRKLELPKMNK